LEEATNSKALPTRQNGMCWEKPQGGSIIPQPRGAYEEEVVAKNGHAFHFPNIPLCVGFTHCMKHEANVIMVH